VLSVFTAHPTRSHAYREGIAITDIDIPFWRLVAILFKLWMASMPALLAIFAFMAFIAFLIATLFASSVLMLLPKH